MLTVSIVFLLLLLKNVENFQLTKNQILSHLRKQPSALNAPTSIVHQSHTCLVGCIFTLSFNDSLILPANCNGRETNSSCEMTIIINYRSQDILLFSYQNSESLIRDNITYDSATSHVAYLTFYDDSILHFVDYICATGNNCEWEYMRQIIPKLILIDYEPLYNSLLPKIFNTNGHPSLTQCYNNTELVNCSSGTCEYYQRLDNNYELISTRECSIFEWSWVEIGSERYFPGPAIHDYDTIDVGCDKDQCNDQSNTDEIRQIISSNSNEYITTISYSSGIKLQWISFSLYFLNFILIKYFK